MNQAPYSLYEAQEISAEYQYLVGQQYDKSSSCIIECITITPFDAVNRERFLVLYFLLNSAERALAQEYKGMLYDVLVIARSTTDKYDLQQESLFTWLAENKGVTEVIINDAEAKSS